MPTPMRTMLALAVQNTLAAALPAYTVERARRDDPDESDRPLLCIDTDDGVPDHERSPGETVWTIGVTVWAYPAPAASATEALDALAALEAQIVEALSGGGARLAHGGITVCEDMQVTRTSVELYPAELSASHMGQLTATFTATLWLAAGSASFP